MAVAFLPYTPEHYDSLPPVVEAGSNVQPSGAVKALSSAIGHVFVKYGAEQDFGIILLHNHFQLDPSELLVQFGNAAVPWDVVNNSSDLGNVLPSAWRFVDKGLAPYEFIYASPRKAEPVPTLSHRHHGEFLSELHAVLLGLQLTEVLGLCLLGDKDDAFIHVIWQFGTKPGPLPQPVVFAKHKVAHKLQGDKHSTPHFTTKK